MFGNPLVLEMAQVAVEEAIRLGATFADVRYEVHQREDLVVRNGAVQTATVRSDRGLGLRVLVNGAWGFAAVAQPNRHDAAVLARRATELARASAVVQTSPVRLVHEPAHCAVYRTPIERDPLAVAIEDKMELLMAIDAKLRTNPLIKLATSRFSANRARKLYVSSEGAEIDQDLVSTQVGYQAGASDGHDFQMRSYPDGVGGRVLGRGWELVESLPLLDTAEQVAEEAIEQLRADPCPHEVTDLILAGPQLALQIHHTCGAPAELDRAMGGERNATGSSFLTPERLGTFELGSKHVNLYADARHAGGLGTFGFDDEGVEAQRTDLVSEGRFVGYLSSRESARRVGLERSSGSMRAASWSAPPLVRMTNVCLEPGSAGDLDALIADTKSGVLMDGGRAWSIDDESQGFSFGCETAWEIKDGKKVRRLKNPTYIGSAPTFWGACDAVCDESSWDVFGVPCASKGQPTQFLGVGHGTAPARFKGIEIGAHNGAVAGKASAMGAIDHPDAAKLETAKTIAVGDMSPATSETAEPAGSKRSRRRKKAGQGRKKKRGRKSTRRRRRLERGRVR